MDSLARQRTTRIPLYAPSIRSRFWSEFDSPCRSSGLPGESFSESQMKRSYTRLLILSLLVPLLAVSPADAQRISLDVGIESGVPLMKAINAEAVRPTFGSTRGVS